MAVADPSALLNQLWNDASPVLKNEELALIPEDIQKAVADLVESKTKTYRYAALTQLFAKRCDPSRNTSAVQESATVPGSFDARTFCKQFIVPFDRKNDNVLGGSGDPYVNNPMRIPQISVDGLAAQRDKGGFRLLIDIVDYLESNPDKADPLVRLYLVGVKKRLAKAQIVYAVPNHIRLEPSIDAIQNFLSDKTGGRRLQAVACALMDAIGKRFHLYSQVLVGHINKADAAAGDVADLACLEVVSQLTDL